MPITTQSPIPGGRVQKERVVPPPYSGDITRGNTTYTYCMNALASVAARVSLRFGDTVFVGDEIVHDKKKGDSLVPIYVDKRRVSKKEVISFGVKALLGKV